MQCSYLRPNLLVVISPSVFLTRSHDLQNVLAVLYRPKLNDSIIFFGAYRWSMTMW